MDNENPINHKMAVTLDKLQAIINNRLQVRIEVIGSDITARNKATVCRGDGSRAIYYGDDLSELANNMFEGEAAWKP